jgi:RNA polymerase sigma factor (sigma-70 family)
MRIEATDMETASDLISAQTIVMTLSTDFADLYERHYSAVFRTALRVTGNPADAEDVLQTVFLRVLNQGGRLDSPHSPEAYFRRAATNASLDLLRKRVTHGEIQLDEANSITSGENTVLLKEQLRRAIAVLEPADGLLFLLRFVEGMSNGELADLFGQDKNNIAVRLHRIRQNLQEEMQR